MTSDMQKYITKTGQRMKITHLIFSYFKTHTELVQRCKRATPSGWVKYSTSSKEIVNSLHSMIDLDVTSTKKTEDQDWDSSLMGP